MPLRQIHEQFDRLLQSVKDVAIVRLDPQGQILSWNEGAEAITGYGSEEMIGQPFSALGWATDEAGKPATAEEVLEIAATRGQFETEGWRIRKDGTRFNAQVMVSALRDDQQRLHGYLTVTRDFTSCQTTEEALRRSEDEFRLVVESVKDYAIFMLDVNGYVITWNKGAEAIKGYKAEEIIGQHFSKFYPSEALGHGWPDQELEIAQKEGRFEDEGWRTRKDGTRFWANVLLTPIYDRAGRLRGFSKVTRDLSEKKRAEDELRKSYELLEERVRQRTAELADANAALRVEVEERSRVQASLRESNERHRLIMELMPAAVYVCGADGTIEYFNRRAAELWGREPRLDDPDERYCGSRRLFWPDGSPLPLSETPVSTVLAGGPPVRNQEICMERPDGSRITVMFNIDPLFSQTGRLVGAINVFHDISDQKELFEQLRRSEERFRHLVYAMPAAVYTTDLEGRITLYNERAMEIWGRRPGDEDRWNGTREMYHADGTRMMPEEGPLATMLRNGHITRGQEMIIERPDGTRSYVLPHPEPLRDPSGKVVGAVNMLVDITDRKFMEETLREHAEEVGKLMDVLPVAVWVARDPQCERITGNRAGYEMLRRAPGTNLSLSSDSVEPPMNFRVLINGREVPSHELPMQYAAAHAVDVRDLEETIVFDNGDVVHVFGSASPLFDAQGRVRGCVAAFMDVSELRRLAAELHQKVEELALADQRKDEFLATLAHELRNPLAPIRTGLELMRLTADDREMIDEIRGTMERQVQQLVRLVDDLLDVSRITRGKVELRRCRVELAEIVRSAIEATQPLISELGHELTVTLPEGPVALFADPTRLAQVVSNLLNNAAKYTPEGGRIWLTAECEGDQVKISVRDTGIGIPPEMIDRIFEMFTQISRSLERGYSGLGIGLTLVQRLVELHEGTIDVRSQGMNQGSEFIVRLPRLVETSDPDQSRSATSRAARPHARRRILVVDDNKDSARSLAMMLRILGNEIRTAYDGFEALEVGAEFRPDVILMDIGMPRLNGYEAAQRIRKEPWGAQVLLIAQTGWGQESDRQRTREAGFDHHLVKPIEPAALQEVLNRSAEPAG